MWNEKPNHPLYYQSRVIHHFHALKIYLLKPHLSYTINTSPSSLMTIQPNMLSPNNPRSKLSRVAKISVKPIWRRKIDSCQSSSDVVPNQPIPKSYAHTNNPSHKQSQTPRLGSTNASSHDEHAQSQNNNPNLITNALLDAHSTKTPSTHEAYLPSISCFHDYPSSNMSHHQECHHHTL